jgi:hypothetical protein
LVFEDIRKLFIDHSKTAISLPDLYEGQDLSKQWLDLLLDSQGNSTYFFLFDKIKFKKSRKSTYI